MDLGHQRTGGIDHLEVAPLAALTHGRRNAMGRIDDALAIGHVVNFMDKNRALFCQLVDNIAIMNDLAAHIDGRTESLQGNFDDVDGAHYPGTKTPWLEQQDPL